jgi:hypothetical protein
LAGGADAPSRQKRLCVDRGELLDAQGAAHPCTRLLRVIDDAGGAAAVVVMALALSFLATLYPSWRAARLDPVEALRYE